MTTVVLRSLNPFNVLKVDKEIQIKKNNIHGHLFIEENESMLHICMFAKVCEPLLLARLAAQCSWKLLDGFWR